MGKASYSQDIDDLELTSPDETELPGPELQNSEPEADLLSIDPVDIEESAELSDGSSKDTPVAQEKSSIEDEDTLDEGPVKEEDAELLALEEEVDALDQEDKKRKKEEFSLDAKREGQDLSDAEIDDELESLKSDLEQDEAISKKDGKLNLNADDPEIIIDESVNVLNDQLASKKGKKVEIFDVGKEEKQLLEIAKYIQGRIPDKDWNEMATAASLDQYEIQEGDWLWKISKTLFGSGFYYSKIWSLNPQITNPHEIEPGMVLYFDTGAADRLPQVKVSNFKKKNSTKDLTGTDGAVFEFSEYGENVEPKWLDERAKLMKDGVYFQYASEETYKDLALIASDGLNFEYKKYDPPVPDVLIREPGDDYDETGFDRNSKITFDFKEGFYLNSFVMTNIIQDLGFIHHKKDYSVFIKKFEKVYVKFDSEVKVKSGDLFSVYNPEGKVSHPVSEREGHRYTITAQLKAIRPSGNHWECEVIELSGLVQRNDRLTVYTPKINRITKTFSKRDIEAAILDSYKPTINTISFGDVVYLDRGRVDGVEVGNVFEAYSSYDKGTEKRITQDPVYKTGELTVITVTDNFSTALVTNSSDEMRPGVVVFTKTEEDALRKLNLKNKTLLSGVKELETKSLDDLDLELKVDDLSEDILAEADKIQLTEDELEELERQEREKSIIKDHERDLKALEKLEREILDSEKALLEGRVDEDKFLEQQNLDDIEKKKKKSSDAFENINELEKKFGRKYLDENLNSKDNPYGLTEFDVEEIDELLNSDQQ